jgi:uncharacterized protein (DUF2147 family)
MKFAVCAVMITSMAALVPAVAQEASPVGLWKNIDDVTGKPKALIRISEDKGELRGQIEKLFPAAGEDPNPKCTACTDARKNQPVIGMVFMSGLKKSGDEYTDGEILDPDNGKVYRSKMSLADGGKKLKVRGYVGVPMFGRSQVWVRQD